MALKGGTYIMKCPIDLKKLMNTTTATRVDNPKPPDSAVQPIEDPYVHTKLLQQVCTVCEFGAIDSDDQFYCDLGKAPSKCSTCVEALQNILKILHIPPCHFTKNGL